MEKKHKYSGLMWQADPAAKKAASMSDLILSGLIFWQESERWDGVPTLALVNPLEDIPGEAPNGITIQVRPWVRPGHVFFIIPDETEKKQWIQSELNLGL